jgi:hypothetical protein
MKTLLKKIFFGDFENDKIIEGVWAHEYPEPIKDQIKKDYVTRWSRVPKQKTPETHPLDFDPCNPPKGWLYDPYYETWINNT